MNYLDAFDSMNDGITRVRSIGWVLRSIGASEITPPEDTLSELGDILCEAADKLDECERAFERGE